MVNLCSCRLWSVAGHLCSGSLAGSSQSLSAVALAAGQSNAGAGLAAVPSALPPSARCLPPTIAALAPAAAAVALLALQGLWFSRLLSLFGDKEARILVLGLDNAGKTTILCE